MLSLINYRLRITLNDRRHFIGQMLAFDRHMNLVLADCEEFRRVRQKKKGDDGGPAQEQELKRALGLVILRGEFVSNFTVEGPPPVQDETKKAPSVRVEDLSVFLMSFSDNRFSLFSFVIHQRPDPSWYRSRNTCRSRDGHDAAKFVITFCYISYRDVLISKFVSFRSGRWWSSIRRHARWASARFPSSPSRLHAKHAFRRWTSSRIRWASSWVSYSFMPIICS